MSQLYGYGNSVSTFNPTTSDYEKVVDRNRRQIEMLVGPFYNVGFCIWTTQELDETLQFDVRVLGKPMTLTICKDSEAFIAPIQEN